MARHTTRLTAAIVGSGISLIKTILFLPAGCCRFRPTCSAYAREAFERFGIIPASWLVVKRLCRCHPFSSGGDDPVPAARSCPERPL